MTIKYYDNIAHSPVWEMIPRAMEELECMGYGFAPAFPPAWNDSVIVVENDAGNSVAFMAFRRDEVRGSLYILLAHVDPAYRREGVHTMMFEALVARARAMGNILSIDSGTHINNTPARRAFEKQGRVATAITYEYRIKEFADGKKVDDLS